MLSKAYYCTLNGDCIHLCLGKLNFHWEIFYFQTSNTEALTLPVPGDILQIIIVFLYTDDAPAVTGKMIILQCDRPAYFGDCGLTSWSPINFILGLSWDICGESRLVA